MTDEKEHPNGSGNIESKLQNLKKELKCWESMFFRSHGRKPGKNDIDSSGNEIRATYKEYFHIKSKLHGTPRKEEECSKENEICTASTTEKVSKNEKPAENKLLKESASGVFGADLNRSRQEKMTASSHLKEKSLVKRSFTTKRHLKIPFDGNCKNINRNEMVEADAKSPDMQSVLPDPIIPAINEETTLKNDLHIISNEKIATSNSRRSITKVSSAKAGTLSRSYRVSSTWLEKYDPKTEQISNDFDSFNTAATVEPVANSSEKNEVSCSNGHEAMETFRRKEESSYASGGTQRSLKSNGRGCTVNEETNEFIDASATFTEQPSVEETERKDKEFSRNAVPEVCETEACLEERIKVVGLKDGASNQRRNDFKFDGGDDANVSNVNANWSISPPVSNAVTAGEKTIARKRKTTETICGTAVQSNAVYESECSQPNEGQKASKKRRIESAENANQAVKIPRGKRLVSENFVRIDISKKKFCRGKRRINAATYKRQQWKKKTQFKNASSSSSSTSYSSSKATAKCFKCGKEGHWAKECAKKSFRGNPDRGSTFDGKTNEDYRPIHESEAGENRASFSLEDVPHLPRCWPRIPYQSKITSSKVVPLFAPVDGKPSEEALNEVKKALRTLGYSSFRHGQESTVARIVSGLSTLLVLSTGSGKSLCYQLPAYLYYKRSKYLTIVISPLVALMEDQVSNLPYGLKGACFHTNMTKTQRDKVMRDLTDGKIAILLLSPEALVSGSSATGYMPMLGSLPPIAFACIDEAHCVSEWSHNFRPNYLRVCKVLREELGVRCFLGLTATATKSTSMSITKHLLIDEADSVGAIIRGAIMPDNLHLTVSRDDDRDRALVQLLSGPRFERCTSIIIYCTRREETERLSSLLRTCLKHLPPTELDNANADESVRKVPSKRKGAKTKKPKLASVSWDAECYHAGMSPAQRRRVQKNFMSGELRIVVATTAFGMGLDKSDVRAIIHYNMPKSFESFLQEVGRAGRDGLPAHCHVFLDDEANDLCELRRHTYANSVDKRTVKRLVNKIFKSCDCRQRSGECPSANVLENRDYLLKQSARDCGNEMEFEDGLLDDLTSEDFEEFDGEFRQCITTKKTQNESSLQEDRVSGDAESRKDHTEKSNHQNNNETDATNASNSVLGSFEEDLSHADNRSSAIAEAVPAETLRRRCCTGHHVAFSIEGAVQDLDMPEENISTLLSYLELHRDSMIRILNPVKATCTIKCYAGADQMKRLAQKFMPMTAVFNYMKRNRMTLSDNKCISFDIVEVADEMGWDLDVVYRELRSIQWNTQYSLNNGDSSIGKSGVISEFGELSFHVISPGDLSDDERDNVCKILSDKIEDQEQMRILQLDALYNTLSQSSHDSYHAVVANHDPAADRQLRENVEQYFECSPGEMKALLRKLAPENIHIAVADCKWDAIGRDVRTMLGLHHDVTFNGRAMARIFHGINSPCFPAIVWGRDRRFWRRYLDVDFNELRTFITKEIIKYRT
eukprot:gene19029-20942_t